MQPDLELVAVRRDESFKVWSHGYPYRTVRWHFHPEYEIHLIVATTGKMFVGDHISNFAPGNLVLIGPNLPHNWVSEMPQGQSVAQRNLVVQFGQEFVSNCVESFPEWRQVEALLVDSRRGVSFGAQTSAAIRPLFLELLAARGLRRLVLFMSMLEILTNAADRETLASPAYRTDPSGFASTRINHVLSYIGKNLANELRESDLAQLAGQSVSAFSRYFRRHTGLPFVQYVNRMRINLACQLLADEALSVTDVCFKAGFNNLSNFNRQFLAVKGMAPSRFRRFQQLNDASREASEQAAARGVGVDDAPALVSAPGLSHSVAAAYPPT
ncbi:DNA-binding domain-containing protein, AraC-type [Burkholderia sp. Ch1-1]|uniref:DNA-binding domain-containing protein, AraC-type n=1 Tax=Paraburkholderia dioscoreae TaxID=2604047 RepID=A0A5Q4YU95_9BURK|nr:MULTISPECIES: AraC family transcriptional regulator [Paraburkholderia]EIF29824.1 DNA-binding domain-containing protein, AraC-type [Burkholderia sp. Ch1-1]MDR8396757.1 AraC family transcriptional regulator [Paraburkholderia sp. USG1]VVD30093.1 DNA-binding domain-containing protein, AraC-type [Paraburkholderia dioscoreae]